MMGAIEAYRVPLVRALKVYEGEMLTVTWRDQEYKTVVAVSGTVSEVVIFGDRMLPLLDEEGTG